MKHDNPFAKLGALDQQLYQETAQEPHDNTDEKLENRQEKERKGSEQVILSTKQRKKEAIHIGHDTMIPRHHDTTTP
jgi:hypothetical protein